MSKNVYCKDCKWLERGEYKTSEECTHPSVYVTITKYDPVDGVRVEKQYNGLSYNPYVKNADLSCKDFEENWFVKLWKAFINS